eukprot:PhF_6_TR25869/c0_g1_i1/m.36565
MRVPVPLFIIMVGFLVFTFYSVHTLQSSNDTILEVSKLERRVREAEDAMNAKESQYASRMEQCTHDLNTTSQESQKLKDEIETLKKKLLALSATPAPTAEPLHAPQGNKALASPRYKKIDDVKLILQNQLQGVAAKDCLSMGYDLEPYSVVPPERLPSWAKPYTPHSADTEPKEDTSSRQNTFSEIATSKVWGATPSGSGSLEGRATDKAIQLLLAVIKYLRATHPEFQKRRIVMLDIPCGDMNWMKKVLFALPNTWVEYHGIDIVEHLIQSHKNIFKAHTWMNFHQRDVVEHGIPMDVKYDIIFSRHMLQHLATKDSLKVLRSIHAHPTAKYLFTTTYPDWQAYVALTDLLGTRVRKLNLQLPPASLKNPICWGHDFSYSYLALFKLPLELDHDSEIERA